ncbi:MAG: serine hydrolase [Deltaproteobacteria bacterium]|nr:serine hydrolase [Deltaproteobacteria bacterium]
MRLFFLLVAAAMGLTSFGPSPAGQGWAHALEPQVLAAAEGFTGGVAFYVREVASGEEYGFAADTPMYLSSAVKVVVMLEVLRQTDAGLLSLHQRVRFRAEDVRDGVGPIGLGPPGRVFTVRQLLVLMMDHSDNAAADRLMGLVGLENLNNLPARRGVAFSRIDTLLGERRRIYSKLDPAGARLTPRQIYELGRCATNAERARLFSRFADRRPAFSSADMDAAFEAFYADRINTASMRQVGQLLDQLSRCEGLSEQGCALAHKLMAECRTGKHRIRAGLPEDAAWEHKTGTQHHRACDIGILYPRPGRPVVIAACTRGFTQVRDAERLLANLGRAVWKALGEPLALEATGRPQRRPTAPRAGSSRAVAPRDEG